MDEISDACEGAIAYFKDQSMPVVRRVDFYVPTEKGEFGYHNIVGLYNVLTMFDTV